MRRRRSVGSGRFVVEVGLSVAPDPLWPLVLILAEIATRVERQRAAEEAESTLFMDDRRESNQDAQEPTEAA